MSTLSELYAQLDARHQLGKNHDFARLHEAFAGKEYEVVTLLHEVIVRRKLVKEGNLSGALDRIPRQVGEGDREWNDRSEVAATLVINAILDEIESWPKNHRRGCESGLLNDAIELLMERRLGWSLTDGIGYVLQSR